MRLVSLQEREKREIEAQKIRAEEERLATIQREEEAEQKRTALAQKMAKEREKKRIALVKKLEREKRAKERKRERERIALAQKRERERVAKEKRLHAILMAKEELERHKKESEEKRLLTKLYSNEIKELEKLDVIESDHPTDELTLLSESKEEHKGGIKFKPFKKWFKYALGYSYSLKNLEEQDTGREALKFTLMANPQSYFFAGATFSLDTNSYNNIYYQPDFSYSFGYSDWHQDTWSFGYANYANNKISPKGEEKRFNSKDGTWDMGYKTKIEDISLRANLKHTLSSSSTIFSVGASTHLGKKTLISAKLNHHFDYNQEQMVISAKTFLFDKFFISGSAYLYSDIDAQTDLEPDYAYSFGWKDSRPFHPSITYSNYYTPTRWGWRDKRGPHFEDGTLSLNFNLKF